MTFLYTFKGKDIPVLVHVERDIATALCPVCGLLVIEASYIQEHLNWHSERLGS